jgi:hypothetical protein
MSPEVDGGAVRDGGADRRAARDGALKQPEMGRGYDAAVLEKAAAGGCVACDERPCAATLETTSRAFLWRYGGRVRAHSEAASGVWVRALQTSASYHYRLN